MEIPLLGSWWTVVVLILGGVLYLYLTWSHDYWRKRGIPYVKPTLLFGNIRDAILVRKTLGEVYTDCYWKLDGHKYGGIFKFGQPTILIRDPELVKTILVKDFNSFHDNDIEADPDVDPLFGRNPFVLKGEKWKHTRSLLTPAFTMGKIKPYFPLITAVCDELKGIIEKKGQEFDAKELCAQFTTDVVATCAYGIRGGALQDPNCEFRRMGREILEPSFWKNIQFLMFMLTPRLSKFLQLGMGSKKVLNFFQRIISESKTYREENNIVRADYLQHLLTLQNKGKIADDNDVSNGYDVPTEKSTFTDIDILAQASTFFVDGYETSSGVLSFCLYCMAVNPEVQEAVRQEIDTVLSKHGGNLTFEGLQEMTYLDLAIQESLRIYPPGFFLMKVCTKPFKLDTPSGGTYEVEVGTPVIIPLYAIHMDPQYFPDPKRFDPERFTEENKKTRHRYSYFPFGDGPRMCLGFRFAQMQVKAGLASILSNFEARPNKKTPIPVIPDPNYFMYAAKGGLWLDLVKRTDK